MGYTKPKKNLHRDFFYLNHDSVLNSLSAFEAGQVDTILEKTAAATEGGLEGGVGVKATRVGGSKKRQESVQEELVRTRTRFSAFESWFERLKDDEAMGAFDEWDMKVRDEISVGETIHFTADIVVSPLFKVITAYTSFVNNPGAIDVRQQDLASMKKHAKMMESWISDGAGSSQVAAYFQPGGTARPRIVGRLDKKYLVSGLSNVEERYQIVAQVSSLLGPSDTESLLRIVKDAPPTPMEVETVTNAMKHMQGAAVHLKVSFQDEDLSFAHPDVIVRPIAIFK